MTDHPFSLNQHPVLPWDAHNQKLVANVHPADWKNPAPAPRYNLVVIGAGTAGLVAAAGAAGLGAKVALIEKHFMGGDCLNVGCVPSKAIIRAARAVAAVREASEFGVNVPPGTTTDFGKVMERMRRLRADLSPHDSAQRFTDLGVDVFLGAGKFTGPDTVEVGGQTLRFAKAVIATGARAAAPSIPGLKDVPCLTNETLFSLTELPERLGVIGAGPIGCEMAQSFARFGSEVFLVEAEHGILPREDRDASGIVRLAMERDGQAIHDAAFEGELLGLCGKSLEDFGGGGDVFVADDDCRLACEFAEVWQTGFFRREAQEAVFNNEHARPCIVQAGAEIAELNHIQPRVIGDEKEWRSVELLVEVGYDGCFCRMHCFVLLELSEFQEWRSVHDHAGRHRCADGETFYKAALGTRWAGFHDGFDHCAAIVSELFEREADLAYGHGHVGVFIELEFDTARLHFAHGFRSVVGDGASLWVWHQTARSEHFTELADFRHRSRCRHRYVEILETTHAFINHVLVADEFRTSGLRSLRSSAFSEDEHADIFSGTMRERASAAHHLVGLFGIYAETERERQSLVEFRSGHRLDCSDCLGEQIDFLGIALLCGGAITF